MDNAKSPADDSMSSQRWQRVKDLLDEALDHPPGERTAFLDERCAEDSSLRVEVQSLLEAYSEADTIFRAGFSEGVLLDMAALPPSEALLNEGATVGPYRLTDVLGRGGMGTVYRAVRDDAQYEREVALKVIRPGLYSEDVVRRFRAERQILASLEHPGIARLYDGGLTEDGRPYFAMERIEGTPLDRYCEETSCSLEHRFRLLEKAAEATAYAHRKLVVHRDLKPSNILVTPDGQPKLLDFGIAKLLNEELSDSPTGPVTRTGQHLMTPEYAAPEQVRGEAVTPATDVYALGVILYQLLTGHRPYAFEKRTPSHVERVICETQPLPPSTSVTRTRDGDATVGLPSPHRLKRRLKGDLDRIVLKSLRKEPERRYASAAELADDLRRHREGLPVKARPSTWRYRTGKFVRRHRWKLAAASLFLLLLVGYAATVTVQARRIAVQRDRARTESEKSEQVAGFLVSLFEAGNPQVARGDTVTVEDLLAHGVSRIDKLDNQPAVKAHMLDAMGRAYHSVGQYDEAQPLLERALRLRRSIYDDQHLDVASTLNHLAVTMRHQGNYEKAAAFYDQALAIRRAVRGLTDSTTAIVLHNMAVLENARGHYATSDSLERRALAIQRQIYSGDHADIAQGLDILAVNQRHQGNYAEAARLQREALAMRRRLYNGPHPHVARSLNSLALALKKQGKHEEAERYYQQALNMQRTVFKDDHPAIATTLNNLGMLYGPRGDFEKAEPYLRESLAMRRRLFDGDHSELSGSLNNLAGLFIAQGNYEAALPFQREALRMDQTLLGEGHPYVGIDLHNLGRIMRGLGQTDSAAAYFRQALATHREALPAKHPRVASTLLALGRLLLERGRLGKAESLLREALSIRELKLGSDHWHTADAQVTLGYGLLLNEQHASAEPLLLTGHAQLRKVLGEDHPRTKRARQHLLSLYDSWSKPEQANAWRDSLAAAKGALTAR